MDRKIVLFVAVIGLFAFSSGRALQKSDRAEKAAKAIQSDRSAPTGASPAGPAATARDVVATPDAPAKSAAPAPFVLRPATPACDDSRPLFQLAADFPATVHRYDDCTLSVETGRPSLHVVLATLVNPLVAGFASDFDRAIESIERAAQSQSYVLHRHWFPWEKQHQTPAKDRPGWLVFRRGSDSAMELLLVLVVGEHPSTGIDTAELDTALSDAAGILPAADRADPDPLLVLGPYFSGTAVSLSQQLVAWCANVDDRKKPLCGGKRALFAVTGSATVPRTQVAFGQLKGERLFASSELQATVLPDELLRAGMRRFLHEQLGDGQDEVADLTEASTEYGVESAGASTGARDPERGAGADAGQAAPARPTAGAKRGLRVRDQGPKIPFPMHVGVLAAEADQAPQGDDAAAPRELPSVFDRRAAEKIRLQLDNAFAALSRYGIRHVGIVASSTQDKIFLAEQFRKFAPNLRVHLYESSIDLADRSKRDGLEGLMVASSYPLFPMTQAWTRGPRQLQPFPSMEAEGVYNALLALLSRSGVSRDGEAAGCMLDYQPLTAPGGASGPSAWISVSLGNRLWPLATYSPSELTSERDEPAPPPHLRPGEPPAGRQARVQASRRERLASLCSFIFPAEQASTRCPAAAAQTSRGATVAPTPADPPAGPPPRDVHVGFIAMVGAVAVLLLMLGNIAGFIVRAGPHSPWRMPLLSYGLPAQGQGRASLPLHAASTRRRVTLVGLWALGLTGAVMGSVIVLPVTFRDLATMPRGYYLFGVVLIAVALALLGVHLGRTIAGRAQLAKQERPFVIAVQVLFILCTVGLVPTILGGFTPERRDGHVFFFFLRAVDTGIGLTPTLPLFIVGMTVYLAALLQLSVLRRAASLHKNARAWAVDQADSPVESPRSTAAKAHQRSFAECAFAMRAFARDASRSVLGVCVVGTVGGFLVLFASPLRLGSFEGRLFDAACSAGFALVFTVTVATAWRAHALWLRLQAFTRSLAIHPASAALERLPESVAQRFRSPVPGKLAARHIHIALTMNLHAQGLTTPPKVATLRRALDARWFPAGQPRPDHAAPAAPAADDPLAETRARLQEDFLALKMAQILGLMCDATRRMLLIATVSGMAALFGYAIYPFQPAAALTMAGLISDGLVALVALRVLLGIERDHVLSQLAKTAGGEITPSLGLITRLVGYVIVPLGGLIGSRLQDPGAVIALFQEAAKMLNR